MDELYLTALSSLERITIQYVPKEIALNRDTNTADIVIVGRNNPKHHYSSGSNSFVLELDFHAEQENREDVISKVRLLESWSMDAPEVIRITFGKLFKTRETWIIKKITSKLSMFNPNKGWLPQQAYVSIQFDLETEKNRTKEDVKWN